MGLAYRGYQLLIGPRSGDEKLRRLEFILNVIFVTSLLLQLVVLAMLFYIVEIRLERVVMWWPFVFLLVMSALLYIVSRVGYVRPAAYLLVVLYFLSLSFVAYQVRETDVFTVFGYTMIPVVAGVFIDRRGALVGAILSLGALVGLFLMMQFNIVYPAWWDQQTLEVLGVLQFGLLLGVLMIMAWMSNHDIKHFLQRGGSLEVVILQGDGASIKQVESQELGELYRYAEFGRLAGGLFHDLANPLTALMLYFDKLRSYIVAAEASAGVAITFERIVDISKRLEDFVQMVRTHAGKETEQRLFAAENEVVQAAQVFLHKMQKTGVSVKVRAGQQIMLYGSPLKFYQVVLNLISNGIDAYLGQAKILKQRKPLVEVDLVEDGIFAVLTVRDFGSGIKVELLEKIFQPFYTTKGRFGSGIGLATTKDIVEQHFKGTIVVNSEEKKGTVFCVRLPVRKNNFCFKT